MAKLFTPALTSRTGAVIPSELYLNLCNEFNLFSSSVVNLIKAIGRKGEK